MARPLSSNLLLLAEVFSEIIDMEIFGIHELEKVNEIIKDMKDEIDKNVRAILSEDLMIKNESLYG